MTYRIRISRDRGDGGSPITAVRPVRNGVALPDIPVTQPIGYPLEIQLPAVQDGDQVRYHWVNAQGTSGPLPTALIAQRSLTETTVAFEVTSSIASIAFNLDQINPPPSGTWTYAYVPPFAGGEGFSLVGNTFTIFPVAGVPSGTYRVRRTRSDGTLEDLVFVMTAIPAQITFAPGSGVATMTVGANDPATQTYALRPTTEPPGGPWDGLSIPISRAALDAVVGTSPQRAAFFGEPAIGFQTDADSDGQVDQGDVIRIVRGPITSPASVPISSEWEIDGALTGNTDPTYTRGAGVSGTSIRRAWTDGVTVVRSNALPLAQPALSSLDWTHVVSRAFADGVAGTLTRTFQLGPLSAGTHVIPAFFRIGSPFRILSATLGGVVCAVPRESAAAGDIAGIPDLGSSNTDHLIALFATVGPGNSGELVFTFGDAAPNTGSLAAYRLSAPATVLAVDAGFSNHTAAPWTRTRTVNTGANGLTLVVGHTSPPGSTPANLDVTTGWTVDRTLNDDARRMVIGQERNTPAATGRVYTFGDNDNTGSLRSIVISLAPAA